MEELFEDIERLAHVEKRVAMATLVATRGTSPKREGAKMRRKGIDRLDRMAGLHSFPVFFATSRLRV